VEEASAWEDLLMAIKINPSKSGGEAGRLLRRLNYKTRKQRENDRVTFGGLFDRAGMMYDDAREEAPMSETFAAVRRREEEYDSRRQRDIILGRQLAQLYDEQGIIRRGTISSGA